MKRFLSLALTLAICSVASAKPPEQRVLLLVGSSAAAQEQAAHLTEKLVTFGPTFEVVRLESEAGAPFELEPNSSYLVRQVDDQIVWQRTLLDWEKTWSDFQGLTYDVSEGEFLGWSRMVPESSERPLRRDELIEFYAGGLPNLDVTATIGGQQVSLKEEEPGYYAGGYRVAPDDRVEASLSLQAADDAGNAQSWELGVLELQGLQPPKLTGLGQVSLRDWILEGDAPPNTTVEIAVAIRLGGLFGPNTLRRTVETQSDGEGHFQTNAQLGTLTSSPQGTVTVKAIDENGVEVLGPEQKVRFQSRVVVRPSYYGSPWGYSNRYWGGRYFRRGRRCR